MLRQQENRCCTPSKEQPEAELFGRAPGVFKTASASRLEFRHNTDVIAITGLSNIAGALAKSAEAASTVHLESR